MGVSDGPMAPNGPGNPAPVSGPSGLSQRTDGGPQQAMQQLSGAKYGEQKSFQQAQAGAPMASAPSPGHPPTAGSGAGPAMPKGGGGAAGAVTPFTAPTARPGEPVTAGAARGAGPGVSALNLPPATNAQDYVALRPAMPALQMLANMPGSSPGIKQFVRYMQAGGLGNPAPAPDVKGSQLS
jgi:hypothetical protein